MKMHKKILKTWISNNQEIKGKTMTKGCNKKQFKIWRPNNNK